MARLTMRFDEKDPYIVLNYEMLEILGNSIEDDIFEKFVRLASERGIVIEATDVSDTYIIKPAPDQAEVEG